ncbi:hypothetical protein BH10BAC6_BH10BAC6_03390 [soil metagenome]
MHPILRTVLVLVVVSVAVSVARQMPPTLSTQIPTKTPQGQTVKVLSETQRYNFTKLTRTIPLPWNELQLPASKVPNGIKLISSFACPSAVAEKFFKETAKADGAIGAPSRTAFQTFKGGTSDGVILYMEWDKVLPADARVRICKFIYKTNEKPENIDKTEEFLVNDHTVIMWCFRNPDAKVKMAHQRQTFELISRVATEMQKNKK